MKSLKNICEAIQFLVKLLKVSSNNFNKINLINYPCLYFKNLGIVFFKKDLSVTTSEINTVPAAIYLLTVNNKNTRTRCELS